MADLRLSTNGAGKRHRETLEDLSPTSSAESGKVSRRDATWYVLLETLLGEQRELAERVCEGIQIRLPAYRSIPCAALDLEVRLEVERVLRSARIGRAASNSQDDPELAAIGEARARQGVPVDDMLRAWRIGVEVIVGYAREVGRRLKIDDAQVLEFVQAVLEWSDVAMAATANAHRRAERAMVLAESERRTAFVRGTLLGTVPGAALRIHTEVYGLDPAAEYVAVRARRGDDLHQHNLEQALGFPTVASGPAQVRLGLCAVVDGDLAGFLIEPPSRQVDGIVGVGPARPLDRLAESYRLAARALVTAETCKLRGAYDMASLGLRAAVALDTEVGGLLRDRYLEPLEAAGSACELIATLRAYLECGMHVERTATKLFVHQNTVRYRLARFEELTGASLRETEVLFELWWALELSAMRL
jgi:hypothetical protein